MIFTMLFVCVITILVIDPMFLLTNVLELLMDSVQLLVSSQLSQFFGKIFVFAHFSFLLPLLLSINSYTKNHMKAF